MTNSEYNYLFLSCTLSGALIIILGGFVKFNLQAAEMGVLLFGLGLSLYGETRIKARKPEESVEIYAK